MTLINPKEHANNGGDNGDNATINVRVPKRILHFSDGVLEEYSDEEEETAPIQEQAIVDPSSLTWMPWLWYKTWRAGANTLSVIDSIGEYLAAFFGITTPKYYFELEEYKRRQEAIKNDEEQRQGWSEVKTQDVQLNDIATKQPQPSAV